MTADATGSAVATAKEGLDASCAEAARSGRQGPASGQEAASLASTLVGLHEELRASLERVEALQKQWENPMAKNSLIRRALRAELRAADPSAGFRMGLMRTERRDSTPWMAKWTRSAHEEGQMDRHGSELSLNGHHHAKWMKWMKGSDPSLVPDPEFSGPMPNLRLASWRLVNRYGLVFDSFIGLVIFVSSVNVGVEIQCDLQGSTECASHADNLEHLFLVIFILELLVRANAEGLSILRCGWFRFDLALVVVGVISLWVARPIVTFRHHFSTLPSKLLILRVLRLTRLARALRFFEQFQEMWKLVNGFMRSLRTVISACVVILLTVYLFACLGVELMAGNPSLLEDPDIAGVIQENFPSLQVTMLTLFQFTSADGLAEVYRPIVEKAEYMGIYFGCVWLVVTIILMNLITAVIVDNAISQGEADREIELDMKRRRVRSLQPHIESIFREIDTSGEGKLSLRDFKSGLRNVQLTGMKDLPGDLRQILYSDHIVEVCEYLDADRSGEIDEGEFIDGVFSLMLQSVPIETTQILQLLRSQGDTLRKIQGKVLPATTERRTSTRRPSAGSAGRASGGEDVRMPMPSPRTASREWLGDTPV